jgi:hypothetical protein
MLIPSILPIYILPTPYYLHPDLPLLHLRQFDPSIVRQAQYSGLTAQDERVGRGMPRPYKNITRGRIVIRPYKNLAMIKISRCARNDKDKKRLLRHFIPRNDKKGSHQQDWWATRIELPGRLKPSVTATIPPSYPSPGKGGRHLQMW